MIKYVGDNCTMIKRVFFIDTFTLLRLDSKSTGLSFDIWLDSLGYNRHRSRKIYVLLRCKFGWKKVYLLKTYKAIPLELRLYLNINKNITADHWNNKISDLDVMNNLFISNHT